MTVWISIVTALGGLSGMGTLLALFLVPASKRHEDTQKRLERLERKVARLSASNANLTAAVAVLIQHDEMLRDKIKELDSGAHIPTTEDILKRFGVNMKQIFDPTPDDDDAHEDDDDAVNQTP